MMSQETSPEDRIVVGRLQDARGAVIYLVVQEAEQYIAIMDVLESSITDLTPGEVGTRLQVVGVQIEQDVLEARLDKLREWSAVSARPDSSRILRHADLLARNWRYTATPAGRQVQRFYKKVLASTPAVREIPLQSLARIVETAEALASLDRADRPAAELIGQLFVNHDHLDSALVGAEDSLAGLVDRFDLNDESAAALKALLVGYATHMATELDHGAERAHQALAQLRPRFSDLAAEMVRTSEAQLLIERGALAASHGGHTEDWEALLAWLDPHSGRSAHFALRLVRALPGMHVNLRRLHSSSGTATSRGRALALAKACADPEHGTAIFLAAVGDHSWRKLYGGSDDADAARIRSWRDGPFVEVPTLLRLTGRAGARGRAPAARDDAEARERVKLLREQRVVEHSEAIREVLDTTAGTCMSDAAARVALVSLLAAVRSDSSDGRRNAVRDGLGCTLFHTGRGAGVLAATTWRVVTPGRELVFHPAGKVVEAPPRIRVTAEEELPRVLLEVSP